MSDLRRAVLALLILTGSLVSVPAARGAQAAQSLTDQVRSLQLQYQALTSLSFSFSQISRTAGRERPGKGNAVFAKTPGQPEEKVVMRWDYTEPDPQIILNDGQNLTIYTVRDNQAVISPSDALEGDVTYTLFAGKSSILDTFAVASPESGNTAAMLAAGLTGALLTPIEPHPQIQTVTIWFSPDFVIHRLVLRDHFDTETDLAFTDIRLNPMAQGDKETLRDLLDLNLPENTEIIRQ